MKQLMKNLIKIQKTSVVELQQKEFSPYGEDFVWVKVESYKVRESYYYCFLLTDGSRIPEPIVTKIANSFWGVFVPKKFWESVKRCYMYL